MTSVNYIKDDTTGSTFIPSSQRPDGSWRRPIRVKDGYVPQEEQPLYVSKGKQTVTSPYPVGLSPDDISNYSSHTNSSRGQRGGSSSLYFDVGLYSPAPVTHPIPGLNFVETPVPEKTSSKSRSKKSKSKNKSTEQTEDSSSGTTTTTTTGKKSISQNNSQPIATSVTTALTTDPVKRLRNLRKKLKDIEALEKKIDSGELKNPEKEQLEKIQRKEEVLELIAGLIDNLEIEGK